jgi:uncharacterized protein
MKTKWKTLSGKQIKDIGEWVAEATREGQDVHVGTDSLVAGKYTQFVTVVVVLTPRKGGAVAYQREVVQRSSLASLRERLFKETWISTSLAMELSKVAKGEITIHVDVNTQERHMSQRYLQELTGLVVGQGFKCLVKPDSWAASHAADHIVRTRGRLPGKVLKENTEAARRGA